MKPLTEKQAWLFIARAFEKPEKDDPISGMTECGLCRATNCLVETQQIEHAHYLRMKKRIQAVRRRHGSYIWPLTKANRLKRAKLARKFARECGK